MIKVCAYCDSVIPPGVVSDPRGGKHFCNNGECADEWARRHTSTGRFSPQAIMEGRDFTRRADKEEKKARKEMGKK